MLNVRRNIVLLSVVAAAAAIAGGQLLAGHDGPQGPAAVSQAPSTPGPGSPDQRRGFGPGQGRGPGQDVRAWWKDPDMAKEVGLTPVQVT